MLDVECWMLEVGAIVIPTKDEFLVQIIVIPTKEESLVLIIVIPTKEESP